MIGKIFFAAAFGVTAGIALIVFIVLYGPGNEAPRAVERPVLEQTHFFVPQIVSPAQTPVEPERVEVEIHEWVSGAVPGEVRGIYLTRWSAGSAGKLAQVLELARQDIINAVVIDVKDFSGYLAYDTDVPLAKTIGAEQRNIPDPESYLASLHEAGLYTIARITVFQDPVLAEARPDLAIKFASSNDREIWRDHKGLPWVDPASKEVWEYNAALAKDAFTKGFDEVNFDYIRFPSDGDIFDASYPFWDEETPLQIIIASFFAYLHGELEEGITSVDLFGLAAANTWDDMGIGQILEDAFPYFDFISPMVYPSHFAPGFKGLERPDEHPYEIVRFSMARAKDRLDLFQSQNNGTGAKLRPWLQYFDLAGSRVRYTPEVIREQILGARDGLKEEYGGYLLWNSANVYPAAEVQEIVFGSPPDAFKEDTSLLE